jgi:hypothetical protein
MAKKSTFLWQSLKLLWNSLVCRGVPVENYKTSVAQSKERQVNLKKMNVQSNSVMTNSSGTTTFVRYNLCTKRTNLSLKYVRYDRVFVNSRVSLYFNPKRLKITPWMKSIKYCKVEKKKWEFTKMVSYALDISQKKIPQNNCKTLNSEKKMFNSIEINSKVFTK